MDTRLRYKLKLLLDEVENMHSQATQLYNAWEKLHKGTIDMRAEIRSLLYGIPTMKEVIKSCRKKKASS
jgi:hypothetical protein